MDLEDLSKQELIDILKRMQAQRKYGLAWEEEKTREHFDFDNRKVIPILHEEEGQRLVDEASQTTHSLIEGDNYYALSILRLTHARSIDFIYIDPPYNTGNKDFKYNDVFVDKEDTFRHSKWLSFMSKRLLLAKDLLSENGVIFLSIGDDEQANLKLLMDKIFGESNYITTIPRLAKTSSDKGTFYAPSKDYVLAYRHPKRVEKFNDVLDEEYAKKFKGIDEKGHYATVGLYQAALDPMRGCINQRYWIECPDGSFIIPPGEVFPDEIAAGSHVRPQTKGDKVWRWSYERYLRDRENLVFKKSKRSPMLDEHRGKSEWNVDTKYYLEERQEAGKRPRDWMEKFLNTAGTSEMNRYELDFSYPKPSSLIKYLIQISHSSKDITVLDFFAGSGTTGDAVLQLNSEDSGIRKFILVTNNEENICDEVTYPRLKKAINGFVNSKGEEFNGLGGNLNFLRIGFIDRTHSSDEMKVRMSENCVDLLRFREGIFEEVLSHNSSYRIFKAKDSALGIYTSFDYSALEEMRGRLMELPGAKKACVFTFDNLGLNPLDFADWEGIQVEPIPQKIMEVLGEVSAY